MMMNDCNDAGQRQILLLIVVKPIQNQMKVIENSPSWEVKFPLILIIGL